MEELLAKLPLQTKTIFGSIQYFYVVKFVTYRRCVYCDNFILLILANILTAIRLSVTYIFCLINVCFDYEYVLNGTL